MGKGKGPRKRRDVVRNEPSEEKEIERQTQEKADLVPPGRLPPTAVGAETPPLPPNEPRRPPPVPSPSPARRPVVSPRPPSALVELVSAIRVAVGALLDLADAAADAITKQVGGRA
jgi:hypothetical protein